jgi:transcriptional regulator EpsA
MFKEHLNGGNEGSASIAGSLPIIHQSSEKKSRSGKERRHATFFDVIDSSLAINSPEQLIAWMEGDLQHIFPHGMMICGIGDVEDIGLRVHNTLSHNFPSGYVQTLQQAGGLTGSPIMIQWLKTRRPVLFEMTDQHANSSWLENFKRYGLHNLAAHGLCDIQSRMTSYFSFSRIPGKFTQHHAELLERLVPHLHASLIRAFNGAQKDSPTPRITLSVLTPREQEVFQWLRAGKTNWEIAKVLHISESTIKSHVQRILMKLKANNRAQAVGLVVAEGLLPQ